MRRGSIKITLPDGADRLFEFTATGSGIEHEQVTPWGQTVGATRRSESWVEFVEKLAADVTQVLRAELGGRQK